MGILKFATTAVFGVRDELKNRNHEWTDKHGLFTTEAQRTQRGEFRNRKMPLWRISGCKISAAS
jgi:hypothetical protein